MHRTHRARKEKKECARESANVNEREREGWWWIIWLYRWEECARRDMEAAFRERVISVFCIILSFTF